VLNEDEVIDVLGEWGFKKYRAEELSFEEQVSLFAKADAVAGAHGAGLMNILFSQNISVVEFLGPKTSYNNPGVFYTIAQSLGHEYGCLEATVKNRNLYIDPDDCHDLLRQLNL
jgi:capsular polysaccharide biosynthesis protein